MKKITKYGVKRLLFHKYKTYKEAKKSSSYDPVFYPYKRFILMPSMRCNGDCSYCANLLFPDANNQFLYEEVESKKLANAINRFYGQKHIYLSGGECAMLPSFLDLISNIKYNNISILTNLSLPSFKNLEKLLKIKTTNIYNLNISYHIHMMELQDFVNRYHSLKGVSKDVHIIAADGVAVEDTLAVLNKYDIKAKCNREFTNEKFNKIKPKTVKCSATNFQIMPDGSLHSCRARGLMKCEPVASIFDKDFFYDFKSPIKCDYYGLCGPCDIDRKIHDSKM